MTVWSKKAIEWFEGNTVCMSVPFTWNLPNVYSKCVYYRQQGYDVLVGGPAVRLMPHYLEGVARVDVVSAVKALSRHNPEATRTSTGCVNACEFCAVKTIEGDLRELEHWEPSSIVCDNNPLACSRKHFDKLVDSLKPVPEIDFNQGLDCRIINAYHIERLQELDIKYIRFSWDYMDEEYQVMDAIKRVRAAGFPKKKIRIYILFNFHDDPEDALYRFNTIKQLGLKSFPMRYQPLDTLAKNSYVAPLWSNRQCIRYMEYWSKQAYLSAVPFEEFRG
jgi:hypothetical protein